jgi:integrase
VAADISWEQLQLLAKAGRKGWCVVKDGNKIRLRCQPPQVSGVRPKPQNAFLPFRVDEPQFYLAAAELVGQAYELMQGGEHTLKGAVNELLSKGIRESNEHGAADWQAITAAYKQHLQTRRNRIPDSTYDCNYKPFFDVALDVLKGRKAPQTGHDLINAVLHAKRTSSKPGKLYGTALVPWAERPSSRYACCLALKNLLEFAFDKHGVPRCWRVGQSDYVDLLGPRERPRLKASLTDQEIYNLHKAIQPRNHRWANVIRLLAAYGLREWEINYLEARINHEDDYQMFCTKGKVSSNRGRKQQNPERWLIALPLSVAGETIDWSMLSEWRAGKVELPPTVNGKAFGAWLRRQPEWQALKTKYEAQRQYLKPYAFRDSFSVRCTRIGVKDGHASELMGHSPEVHRRSYRTSREEDVLDAVRRAVSLNA